MKNVWHWVGVPRLSPLSIIMKLVGNLRKLQSVSDNELREFRNACCNRNHENVWVMMRAKAQER